MGLFRLYLLWSPFICYFLILGYIACFFANLFIFTVYVCVTMLLHFHISDFIGL